MSNGLRMTTEAFEAHQLRVKKPQASNPPLVAPLTTGHGIGGARSRKVEVARTQSNLEVMLEFDIEKSGLPAAKRNYRFHGTRKWELDFAWPDRKLAVEVQGMVHRIKARFEADVEKRYHALEAGWTVLEVSGKTIRDGRAITWLENLFKREGANA